MFALRCRLLFLPMLAFAGCSILMAQNAVSTGTIDGQVHDPAGQAVVHAVVTVVNEATGEKFQSETNDAGLYIFPALKIGVYDVTVSRAGFSTAKLKGVSVGVGNTTDANATLLVGEISQTVEVDASDASTLNPSDTGVGTLIEQTTISALPLNGRRYTDLVLLTPNVTADGEFGHISFAGQSGGTLSGYQNTSGGSSNANGATAFSVDGADSTSYYYGDSRGYTRIPYLFGLQSVAEFQVQPNVYNSSYGGAGAGFINTVTKSGTNRFHGDAFYYNRNSATGANDAIDKGAGNARPLNVLQQFGADIGGPLVKDKVFFYFDYEQQRHKDPLYAVIPGLAATTVSSFGFDAAENAPVSGLPLPAGTVLPAPNSHYPTPGSISLAQAAADPTNPVYLQGVSNALNVIHSNLGPRQRRRDDYEFFPKLDWQLDPKTRITALYNYNHFQTPGGIITFSPEAFAADELLGNNGVRDHVATIHMTHTYTPNLVEDRYVSYVRDEQLYSPSGLAGSPTSPQMILTAPATMLFGNATFSYNNLREYQTQFSDHLTYLVGHHQLDMGASVNYDSISNYNPGAFYGQYIFFSLQALALGDWNIFQQTTGNARYNFSDPFIGFYINDTWHALKNLTVSYGVREDFQKYPNPQGNPLLPSTQVFHNQYERVSPRAGFSYNPFPKTVIRGGAGLYYEIFVGNNYQNSTQTNGVSQTTLSLPNSDTSVAPNTLTPSYPNALPASDPHFVGGGNIATIASNYKTPSVVNASLQIEQEIAPHTLLTIGSLWSHGMHLTSSTAYDENQNAPTGTVTYTLKDGGTFANGQTAIVEPNLNNLTEGRIVPSLGQINALISPGIDNYNSLFVSVNRQVSHGLSVVASYTLSKSTQSGVDFYNQFNLQQTHSLSLLDQRQRLVVAGIYAPKVDLTNPSLEAILNNWRISVIGQLNSGHPYTGAVSNLNDSAANQVTNNTAAGLVGGSSPGFGLAPGDGLNSFTGPGIEETDLAIERSFTIHAGQAISLKAQVFNLLNAANYYVYGGSGINQTQYTLSKVGCNAAGTTCELQKNNVTGGFQTLELVNQANPPRVFQFSFAYHF